MITSGRLPTAMSATICWVSSSYAVEAAGVPSTDRPG